jgi:putative NADPH-quinone reductase
MRVVVVVAHPNPASFTQAIAAAATAALERSGHEVTVLDLAGDGFRAAMSAEERVAYHGDEPVVDPMVAEHVRLVRHAEALVFVYPTWWSSVPAVLKGWLERVMVPGVGFAFNDRDRVRPALTNVRRIVGISTYGSPWRYVKLVNDNGRRTITRALRVSTGLRTRCRWLAFYAIDTSTADERAAFVRKVETAMARL